MSTATSSGLDTIVERMGLKTLVESCLVLEEGVASAKDIEIGMMMGAGILPGPFARADAQGLDDVLEALERAHSEWGEHVVQPLLVRAGERPREDARTGHHPGLDLAQGGHALLEHEARLDERLQREALHDRAGLLCGCAFHQFPPLCS